MTPQELQLMKDEYCEQQLRKEFDDPKASYRQKETIMYQAEQMGFMELTSDMANDLYVESKALFREEKDQHYELHGWLGF